jgi:poly(3-hydroxybutyrate) depolymerase
LPALGADAGRISVSGFSSGAFMAVQYDVAFSASTIGVGVVAGGPYNCAYVNFGGMDTCIRGAPSGVASFAAAVNFARSGQIDPVAGLRTQKVYLFGGTNDTRIRPAVVQAVREFFIAARVPAANIQYVNSIPAGHAFLSAAFGSRCGDTHTPFIDTCAGGGRPYDQPEAILTQIYGPLNPKATEATAHPKSFDQTEFLGSGFAEAGYVYIPKACESKGGGHCAVHVVFHGCQQDASMVGDAVYGRLGYNAWADSNRIIVLYPQVDSTTSPPNPEGCWDWWGYSGLTFQTKAGSQLRAVRAMVDRLTEH